MKKGVGSGLGRFSWAVKFTNMVMLIVAFWDILANLYLSLIVCMLFVVRNNVFFDGLGKVGSSQSLPLQSTMVLSQLPCA